MPSSSGSEPTFEAFSWADEFATHLRSLGARDRVDLFALGRELYAEYKNLNPEEAAETVWAQWTSDGPWRPHN